MDRRDFIRLGAAAAMMLPLANFGDAFAAGRKHPEAGRKWKGWSKGHLQVHFIYTGVCESAFYIFPDGTSMLLDCGDHDALGRGELSVPVLPHPGRHSGEWIARYVNRVNPHGKDVDYMMLSHYHNDHAGCYDYYASADGDYHYSGFAQAAQTLDFHKAFDRLWPDYDGPLSRPDDYDGGCVLQMKKFYARMSEEKGMEIERFRVGAVDQVKMVHSPAKYSDFHIRNICGNGCIYGKDGVVKDLYEDYKDRFGDQILDENGLSLGMIVEYGQFRLFTAGDFSDAWEQEDGSWFAIEDALADICGKVNVAKVSHHGFHSMTPKLVGTLAAQVYVSCVWDQLHNARPTMERLHDRNLYKGDRVVCPGIFPAERRAEDEGQPWLGDMAREAFEGGHVVIEVEPGGERYSVSYLSAADESMTVKSVMEFKSGR